MIAESGCACKYRAKRSGERGVQIVCACIGTSPARLSRADSLGMGALAGEADVCPFAGGQKQVRLL